ncbi:6514_t:CDS:2, partial [Diversispora eburnea]
MVKNTTCNRCGSKLSSYQKYQQHLNRTNPCRPKNLPENLVPIPSQNPTPAPEGDLISFNENPPTHQPREASVPAVDLLTDDISNIGAEPSSNTQGEQKKKSILTIDEIIKWLSKPEIKNNKKIRSKPIPKTDEEWFDLMEKSEVENFNEGEVCDYYAFVPKGYFAEGEPLAFFESIEGKISNVYKKELVLKGGLKVRIVLFAYMKKIMPEDQEPIYKTFPFKRETMEIIREDRINACIEKGYNAVVDQIEDEALQESGWSFIRAEEVFLEISAFRPLRGSSYLPLPEALNKPQLGLINPQNKEDNECFRWCISAYHTREEAIKANRKPPHLNEIRRLRRNANIANYNGIKFPATLHDIDKFMEINPNYAINIFRP